MALQANREPDLAVVMRRNTDRFLGLIRDYVLRMQPKGAAVAQTVLDEQAYVLMSFLGGVMLSFTAGDATITSAEQLDRLMAAMVDGIAAAP